MEDRLLQVLHRHYGNRATAPVFIQSFEVANLVYLRARTRLRLVQLLDVSGQPYDFAATGDPRRYADLASPEGLIAIRRYADAIGVHKELLIPLVNGELGEPTHLLADAHRLGLAVHGWTFRAENAFLPEAFRRGENPGDHGDLRGEIRAYLAVGIDGLFTDQPALGRDW
jgi:glycerophosphoryl diester phosphodiesterase